MCSIGGIFDYQGGAPHAEAINRVQKHRGPDACGEYHRGCVALYHNRLAVIDPQNGAQPMSATHQGVTYTIVYNGELYNSDELRAILAQNGIHPKTASDTELVLYSYILFGEESPTYLNGIFAYCIHDTAKGSLFFARDRLGVKPLYYAEYDNKFYFASEIKAILAGSGMPARLDREGLFELLYLTPVTLTESGVLRGIRQVPPGFCGRVDADGMRKHAYWRLKAAAFQGTAADAIEQTRALLTDAIRRQLVSDVPLACFLSGGLDSSVITAVANESYRARGERLSTYSFEYENNRDYAPTLFQPNRDDDYAGWLADTLGTDHTVLTAKTDTVAALLPAAARYRDLPGQADIDSSLLYFCGEVKRRHTVALSGECADEIFGGYPWFYREEMLTRDFFPWIHDPGVRASLFDPSLLTPAEGEERLREAYREALAGTPLTGEEANEDRRSKLASHLSVNYFMTNLLARKDRMSMAHGLEVRVPFADHRVLEYVYNVPWSIKFAGGVEKALLRNAMQGTLPDRILNRKKSPYPKTHNPAYERAVRETLAERLARPKSRLAPLLNRRRLTALLETEDATWFGQLMSRPQLLGWLTQLDEWLTHYQVELV